MSALDYETTAMLALLFFFFFHNTPWPHFRFFTKVVTSMGRYELIRSTFNRLLQIRKNFWLILVGEN